jgi:alkanesulfonate monooxygenase SsuD/methylene tetrahydromethanopterin reductase-like flavin-dependent oxidoreductase (luciferase family)
VKFDIFHSIGRIDGLAPGRTDQDVYREFFAQVDAAERLGYGTMWVAESHFSSEVQKRGSDPVIPNYQGEVGLNADSAQLANVVIERTQRLGFGTAIMNIVGGNGGPIAAADRVRTLAWLNALRPAPRPLAIGVASGRFPYINQPFGIVPRTLAEKILWPQYQQLVFVEALEIFLRLSLGETLGSRDLTAQRITRALFRSDAAFSAAQEALAHEGLRLCPVDGLPYQPRWTFEPLKLVPDMAPGDWQPFLRFVLGSTCPVARELALKSCDVDLFNLSFTPPAQIEEIHAELAARCQRLPPRRGSGGRETPAEPWRRGRLPRTVLVFIDRDVETAKARASRCFDTYIEAMRGTAAVPPKAQLLERALIGDAAAVRRQLQPDDPHGFHADDRLMLWFEFNQADGRAVVEQMTRFAGEVMPHFPSAASSRTS